MTDPQSTVQPEGSGGEAEGRAPPTAAEVPPATTVTAPTDDRARFLNLIPAEFREHPSLKDYKDFKSFVKSHVNLVGLLGREPRVPAKDAPPDQWNQFFSALGRPDTPDKYTLPIPEGEGAPTIIPEMVEGFRAAAHAAGLSNSQAAKVAEWYFGEAAKLDDARAAEVAALTETTERELRREYGKAYDSKVLAATRIFAEFGGNDLLEWMEATGAGSNPHLIRMAVKLADAMSEDRLGSTRPASLGYTPAEAQREISRLNLDAEFQKALWNHDHPGHADAVKRRSELFAAAYPTEEVPA